MPEQTNDYGKFRRFLKLTKQILRLVLLVLELIQRFLDLVR